MLPAHWGPVAFSPLLLPRRNLPSGARTPHCTDSDKHKGPPLFARYQVRDRYHWPGHPSGGYATGVTQIGVATCVRDSAGCAPPASRLTLAACSSGHRVRSSTAANVSGITLLNLANAKAHPDGSTFNLLELFMPPSFVMQSARIAKCCDQSSSSVNSLCRLRSCQRWEHGLTALARDAA